MTTQRPIPLHLRFFSVSFNYTKHSEAVGRRNQKDLIRPDLEDTETTANMQIGAVYRNGKSKITKGSVDSREPRKQIPLNNRSLYGATCVRAVHVSGVLTWA